MTENYTPGPDVTEPVTDQHGNVIDDAYITRAVADVHRALDDEEHQQ